jgi:hypothetical protein
MREKCIKLKMENGGLGQNSNCRCQCSRCQCCYKKQNHKRPSVLGERTKEE